MYKIGEKRNHNAEIIRLTIAIQFDSIRSS